MSEEASHWVRVRDKPGFLHRMMVELAGNARMSLEGDLSDCQFEDHLVATRDETEILKRMTTFPIQDFVVLRLAADAVKPILSQLISARLNSAIIHVQIERHGRLELGAYDNFHPDCVITGPGVSSQLLHELKSKSLLRDFDAVIPKP